MATISMLDLLNAYDEVVKSNERVGQLQGTRVYRELLKQHRECQEGCAQKDREPSPPTKDSGRSPGVPVDVKLPPKPRQH